MTASEATAGRHRGDLDGLLADGADEVFAALADRTRRRILVRLAEQPDDAGAVARDLDLTRQAVAKHLRVLDEAGLVEVTRQARRRVHDVHPARIREVSDLLGVVARGWDRRLARIKELAEASDPGA
ncbi:MULTISPECIES: ArsR/SmtB family transcription factor [unclassified Brachybacterium]|uniref:ArsR/SmtB family transcription factor n=1 Tax=unclassified Brachybacterium TaxID=2623841 RepID=UPI00361225AC